MNAFTGRTPVTVWVCADCESAHAGIRDDERDEPYSLTRPPMALLADELTTDGIVYAEHVDGCPNGNADTAGFEDCSCAWREFSRTPCDGCGNWDAGYRSALTLWLNLDTRATA